MKFSPRAIGVLFLLLPACATNTIPTTRIHAGYVVRSGEDMTFVLMAGVEWAKTFRPDRAVREWMPTADLRVQF